MHSNNQKTVLPECGADSINVIDVVTLRVGADFAGVTALTNLTVSRSDQTTNDSDRR